MPLMVSEITEGVAFSRSSEEGAVADAQQRIFRVLLNRPGELFDIQKECGVRIGDELRPNAGMYCVSFDARFEGSSRHAILCTFQFRSTAGSGGSGAQADPRSQAPTLRRANWTINSSLYEVPVWSWRLRTGAATWDAPTTAANGVRDMYDGVTALESIVTISIEQFESSDPTKHAARVGSVNSEQIVLGSLTMPPHTVMLRGISSQPAAESWGLLLYRGWTCTYEFAYRSNETSIWIGTDEDGAPATVQLGWDVAIPQTGLNVRTFAPPGRQIDDPFGQPLDHENGRVKNPDNPTLPPGLAPGRRARAHVRVCNYQDGGVSIMPSAQPIPLNDNGRPRADSLMPIVRGYQVHREVNFTMTLGLRLV